MDISLFQPLFDWIKLHPTWAGSAVFLVALTESLAIVGLFMPGVVLMFGIGALISTGNLAFWPTLWWAVAGAIAGDGISFWLGRHYKEQLTAMWPFNRYPALIKRGEQFFLRHGGKSILFGRFIGPVRPIIPATAGMMKMSTPLFIVVNSGSALLWAPAYLVPGMVFGASLGLASAVASRLATIIVILVVLLWLSIWLIKRSYQYLEPRAAEYGRRLLDWGRNHKYLGQITAALVDPQQPELKGLSLLALLLMALAAIIVLLFEQFTVGPPLARLDQSTYHLLQELRSPWGDGLMVVISQLGDGIITSLLIAVIGMWLLYNRLWLAAGHWAAAALFATVVTLFLKGALQLPRPNPLFDGAMTYGFPSAHALSAMTLYGFLAILIARELSPGRRWLSYAAAGTFILTVSVSRLYLGAHWVSDVLGGLLLGFVWAGALGIAYHHHAVPPVPKKGLIALPLLTLALGGGWHIHSHHQEQKQRYAYHPPVTTISWQAWTNTYWAQLPAFRIDTRGRERQPLNLQWAGSLEELQQQLSGLGWQTAPPPTMANMMRWLNPAAELQQLPLLPNAHNGRHEALLLTLPNQQLILRLWPSDTRLTPGDVPLWLGYIGPMTLHQLPLLTLPRITGDFEQALVTFLQQSQQLRSHRLRRQDPDQRHPGSVALIWSSSIGSVSTEGSAQ